MVNSLADQIYTIIDNMLIPYEDKSKTSYTIWISENHDLMPVDGMKKVEEVYLMQLILELATRSQTIVEY